MIIKLRRQKYRFLYTSIQHLKTSNDRYVSYISSERYLPSIMMLDTLTTFAGSNLLFSLTNNSSPTDTSLAYL